MPSAGVVAAQRLAGDPVDVGEPSDPAADENGVDGGRLQAEATGDLDGLQSPRHISQTICLTTKGGSSSGSREVASCGRPCSPALGAERSAHFLAVRGLIMNIFVAVYVHPDQRRAGPVAHELVGSGQR